MGYGDVSAYNKSSHIQTRHINQMAANGVRCSPMLIISCRRHPHPLHMLTGRYNWRSSLRKRCYCMATPTLSSPPTRSTMASMLKANGCPPPTALANGISSWNWGTKPGHRNPTPTPANNEDINLNPSPTVCRLSFDCFYGFCSSLPTSLLWCILKNRSPPPGK